MATTTAGAGLEREAWAELRAAGPFVIVCFVVMVGYMVLGRAFAQVGLAGAGLFIGEVCFAGAAVYRPVRGVLLASLGWLLRPHPLHAVMFSGVALVAYGVFELLRGVATGYPPIEAAKNFAFNYYPVLLVVGLAAGVGCEQLLRITARLLPMINAGYIIVFLLLLRNVPLNFPLSSAPGLSSGFGTIMSLALMVSYDDLARRRWYVLAANVFCLLYLQVRGDWLATIVGVALWASLRQRWRSVIVTVVLGATCLVLVTALDVRIPGGLDRGGSVSPNEVVARALAPFDKDLAGSLSDSSDDFAGTAEWRQEWWSDIWDSTLQDTETAAFGHGYGFPLYSLTWFLREAEEPIRTPHSAFFYVLGFAGWFGVGIFAVFQLAVLTALWRVYRMTGNTFGLMLWSMATASSMFGNFFETPYNAAPYWLLVGLALVPLVREEVAEVMRWDGYSFGHGPMSTAMPR